MLIETDDLIDALSPVVAAFNDLKIPHYVGGSIASSYHGATRSTMDVDLVCEMLEAQIPEFLARIVKAVAAKASLPFTINTPLTNHLRQQAPPFECFPLAPSTRPVES